MIKSSVKKRIIILSLVLVAVIFFVYQVVIWVLNGVITTEAAVSYTVYDEINTEALFIRNEKLIERADSGIYNYLISNGEKVSGGGTIANVYDDAYSAEYEIKLNKLKSKRDELIAIQNTGISYFADIDLINNKIDSNVLSLIETINDCKDLDSLSVITEDLLNQFNKKQISTGYVSNFNELISKLDSQISTLEKTVKPPVSTIQSDYSGYFVNKCDGFETSYFTEDFSTFNLSHFNEMKNSKNLSTENYVGKVIIGDTWNAACVVNSQQVSYISVGEQVVINIPQISVTDIDATVIAINTDKSSNQSVVVIECDYVNDDIVNLRNESISIHANHYSGLRVSRQAIRVVNGVQGVYVLSNNVSKFKPIDIIFSSVDFVICKIEDKNDNLVLYDEIITEGTNLYDGKVIK